MKVLKLMLILVLSVGLIATSVPYSYADETSDLILKLLVKKGLVTQKDVDDLKAQIKEVEAKRPAPVKGEVRPEDFRVYWKQGLHFDSADKRFKLKLGGRAYVDAAWMMEDSGIRTTFGQLSDRGEFRAARLYASGTIYDDYFYKAQFDFAGGDVDFKDVYVGMKNVPFVSKVKIGHFKEPFSLEELTSSRFITFMERALPNAFSPGRNVGIAVYPDFLGDRFTWTLGAFRDADSFGDVARNQWAATTRLTWLPWYEEKGKKLWHVGASYSFRNPDETLHYREKPEAHLAPYFVDTGTYNADWGNIIGLETALVYGPFSLQSEFSQVFTDQTSGSSHTYFNGAYLEASYFLTGEHRHYKKSSASFSRVKPKNNFSFKENTFGAWQLAARYSYIDLAYENIKGGKLQDITVGLNWYLNPNMRIMANYIHSHRQHVGDADIVESRFQVDF